MLVIEYTQPNKDTSEQTPLKKANIYRANVTEKQDKIAFQKTKKDMLNLVANFILLKGEIL